MTRVTIHAARTDFSKLLARVEARDLVLVSNHVVLDQLGVKRLWAWLGRGQPGPRTCPPADTHVPGPHTAAPPDPAPRGCK
ncbi:MAG TPA: hypothetical protein VGD56_14035 [Gemmatirosa sp.]